MNPARTVHVTVHYYRYDEQYEGWSLWIWPEGGQGTACPFDGRDRFGRKASLSLPVKPETGRIGLLLRYSSEQAEWAGREYGERYFDLKDACTPDSGHAELWLVQGREELFFRPEHAEGVLRQASARMMDFHTIRADTALPLPPDRRYGWKLLADGVPVEEAEVEALNANEHGHATAFLCKTGEPMQIHLTYTLVHERRNIRVNVIHDKVFDSPQFHRQFVYDGDDLGCTCSSEETRFRLWAPSAAEAFVVLYASWDAPEGRAIPMERSVRGTWSAIVPGDLQGQFYTYRVRVLGEWNEAADPYAKAVSVNGDRGVVLDPSSANPPGWETDARPPLPRHTDAVIYELHVRDFSIHPESGMANKGLYLALTEPDTAGPGGVSTGIRYLRELGVTHVQLLPVFDFSSVDERERTRPNYNWGYDPKNYNVPDGSYSTDPFNPSARIRELKLAVLSLHRNGMRVIMDVVYNHLFDARMSHLGKLVPGYYFRTADTGELANGTGVGNDTASERPMMRKLIVDSVVYWAREYHIDGFRFDLMGIHDTETMRTVRSALDGIDPSILIIGEGWNLNTPLAEDRKAMQANAGQMPGIGHFNDRMRDALKGNTFHPDEPGFAGGNQGLIDQVKSGVAGAISYNDQIRHFAVEPVHCINYVEAHDNHTLWDKLQMTNRDASEDERIRMHKLATAIILTSQGIPFLHAGQEFLRTKQGEENSYRSGDEINRIDWPRRARYQAVVDTVKGWIRLRKEHPALRLPTADLIRAHLKFLDAPPGVLAYMISGNAGGDPWPVIVLVHNANRSEQTVNLPSGGPWHVVCDQERTGTDTLYDVNGSLLKVPAISSMALYSDRHA